MRWSKYHAKKTEVDGMQFDSRKEANRWTELRLMEKAGMIQSRAWRRNSRHAITKRRKEHD